MRRKAGRTTPETIRSPLLTKHEAAEYLRTSIAGVERMAREGEIPVVYVRSRPRFLRADLDTYISERSTLRR
jgi:excisionase family DNA binding protein